MKQVGYSSDPVWNKIFELENRLAILEGKEPIHKLVCLRCSGSGTIREFDPRRVENMTCPDCKGKKK